MEMASSTYEWFATESPKFKDNVFGLCRLCLSSSSQRCKRCSDFYCSEKCQLIDWPNHRYICFPMPPLVNVNELSTDGDVFPKRPTGTFESEEFLKEFRHLKSMVKKTMEYVKNNISNDDSHPLLNGNISDSSDDIMPTRPRNGVVKYMEQIQSSMKKFPSEELQLKPFRPRVKEKKNIKMDIEVERQLAEFFKPDIDPEDDFVILCGFRSTNRCAVREKKAAVNDMYLSILKEIDDFGKTAPAFQTMPKTNTYAITRRNNKLYCRVKIVSIQHPDKIRIMFCDFGNYSYRRISDLREMSDDIQDIPILIKIVQLLNVGVYQYNENNIRYFMSLENKEYRIQYHRHDKNHVTLYDVKSGETLNDEISKFCKEYEDDLPIMPDIRKVTISNELTTVRDSIMTAPFQTHSLSCNSCNIKAVIVDTSLVEQRYIACVRKEDMPELLKIDEFLKSLPVQDEPYEPKYFEYVIARFKGSWYRGQVTNIIEFTKYEITFTDFMNESTVTSSDIRPYPKDLNVDCYTTLCIIDGLPTDLEPEQKEFLQNKLKAYDNIFIDRVVQEMDKETVVIECLDVIKEMTDKNLL